MEITIAIADGRALYLNDMILDELARAISQQNRESFIKLVQVTDNVWAIEIENKLRCPLDAASLDKLSVVFASWEKPTDDYLPAAITCMSKSISITANKDPELCTRLLDLSRLYHSQYKRRPQDEDLRCAVRTIERAATTITPDHQYYTSFLSTYGDIAYLESSLLDGAISSFGNSPHLMIHDLNLFQTYANLLQCRYERRNFLGDLKKAIEISEKIAASTPSAETRLCALASLAQLYGLLCEREPQHQHKYVDLAVKRGLEAVKTLEKLPRGSSGEAHVFGALAHAYRYHYLHVGEPKDLDNAVRNGEAAVQLAVDTDLYKPGWLNNLAEAHELLFERTGDMGQLELAISLSEESLRLTPRDGPEKARRLSNLANQLGRRFD